MDTTETRATTELGRREQEARRIARAEGHSIQHADPEWTFFVLADTIELTDGTPATTCFTWEDGRFEGFVSLSR